MKRAYSDLRAIVTDWIRMADLDLKAVTRLLPEDGFRDIVAFHAEQAAERYLKALLTRHQIDVSDTHEIRLLLELLKRVEPDLANALAEAAWLDPFAIEIRYPSDSVETIAGDEIRARELAQAVRDGVMARIEPFLSSE